MKIGMLWFDDKHERTLQEKTERAIAHYQEKYGETPDLCYVHPSMLLDGDPEIEGVTFIGSNTVLPNHLWIGRASATQMPQAKEIIHDEPEDLS